MDIQSHWSAGYDAGFGVNEFNQPIITSEIELVRNVLLYVLFSKPGQYPSLPMIGMDIESRLYSRYDEIDTKELQDEIITQCDALGIHFQYGTIQIKKAKYRGAPSLLIHIEGTESYPNGYLQDQQKESSIYMIGITFDELHRMVYNMQKV